MIKKKIINIAFYLFCLGLIVLSLFNSIYSNIDNFFALTNITIFQYISSTFDSINTSGIYSIFSNTETKLYALITIFYFLILLSSVYLTIRSFFKENSKKYRILLSILNLIFGILFTSIALSFSLNQGYNFTGLGTILLFLGCNGILICTITNRKIKIFN